MKWMWKEVAKTSFMDCPGICLHVDVPSCRRNFMCQVKMKYIAFAESTDYWMLLGDVVIGCRDDLIGYPNDVIGCLNDLTG